MVVRFIETGANTKGCPRLFSSSPEGRPGSRNFVPLVQSSTVPVSYWPAQPLFPAALQLGLCCHPQYLSSHLEPMHGDHVWSPFSCQACMAGTERMSVQERTLWGQRPLLGLDYIILGFQTDQSLSQYLEGLFWALPLTNPFHRSSRVCILIQSYPFPRLYIPPYDFHLSFYCTCLIVEEPLLCHLLGLCPAEEFPLYWFYFFLHNPG